MKGWREILGASPALKHAPPVPPLPPILSAVVGGSGGSGGTGGRISEAEEASAAHGAPELDAFAERAAIREFCGGESRYEAERAAATEQGFSDPAALFRAAALSWRCNFEALGASLVLTGGRDQRGRECIGNARRFIEAGWAEKAAALDWTELELFGVDPSMPWEPGDRRGAAFASSSVTCITAAVIEYSDGQKIWCGQQADGAVLPWEMSEGEEASGAYPHSNIALGR